MKTTLLQYKNKFAAIVNKIISFQRRHKLVLSVVTVLFLLALVYLLAWNKERQVPTGENSNRVEFRNFTLNFVDKWKLLHYFYYPQTGSELAVVNFVQDKFIKASLEVRLVDARSQDDKHGSLENEKEIRTTFRGDRITKQVGLYFGEGGKFYTERANIVIGKRPFFVSVQLPSKKSDSRFLLEKVLEEVDFQTNARPVHNTLTENFEKVGQRYTFSDFTIEIKDPWKVEQYWIAGGSLKSFWFQKSKNQPVTWFTIRVSDRPVDLARYKDYKQRQTSVLSGLEAHHFQSKYEKYDRSQLFSGLGAQYLIVNADKLGFTVAYNNYLAESRDFQEILRSIKIR